MGMELDCHAYANRHAFSRGELVEILDPIVGKTLGEVDVRHVFDRARRNPKITGIAGDVIERSVIGYEANSDQEPDLVVDGYEVELKTTGLRRSKKGEGYEAKEPMSITAVSLDTIADEEFETSNFWHKARKMVIVYYLYDSEATVDAMGYARFPIKGYQFHEFGLDEYEMLKADWQLVHDFVKEIQDTYPDSATRQKLYPKLSSALRDRLMLIDTAPKYPHSPRFRLKRTTVTALARKNFGYTLKQLPKVYTGYGDIELELHLIAKRFQGQTLGEMAESFGIDKINKGTIEQFVVSMFGGRAKRMADIELFSKVGIKAKSVTLTRTGKRTEDMKLFGIDFSEFCDAGAMFESSAFSSYFTEGSMICIVLEEPSAKAPLADNVFKGFKRLAFDDDFVEREARRTYDDIRWLIQNHELRVVPAIDSKTGRPRVNRTGVPVEAPNFPKSSDHIVFVRGTSSDSTRKPERVNGIEMYRQQIWIKGSYVAKRLGEQGWI